MDDHEEKIRKAAREGRIEFASREEIEMDEDAVSEILSKVFWLNADKCFVSDMSSVGDFTGCGDFDKDESDFDTYEAYASAWDAYIVASFDEKLGIAVSVSDTFPVLCDKLDRVRKCRLRPN